MPINQLLALIVLMQSLLWNGASSAQEPLAAEDYFGFHEDRLIDVKINKEGTRIGLSRYIDDFSQVIFLSTEDFSVQGVVKTRPDTFINDFVFIEEDRIAFTLVSTRNSQNSLALVRELFAINTDGSQRGVVFDPNTSNIDFIELDTSVASDRGSINATGFAYFSNMGKELISSAQIINNSRAIAFVLDGNVRVNRLATSSRTGQANVVSKQESPLKGGELHLDVNNIARAAGPFEGEFLFRKDEDDWVDLSRQLADALKDGFDFLSFSEVESQFYYSVNRSNEYIIYQYDVDTSDSEALYTSDRFVAYTEELIFSPSTKTLIGVSIDRDEQGIAYFASNEASKLDKSIRDKFPNRKIKITSGSLDSNYALVQTTVRDTPDQFFVYEKRSDRLSLLGNGNRRVSAAQTSNVSPFFINNAQGKPLNGLLFFPKEFDSSSKTIILPKIRRIPIEYDDMAHFLAEQGILVIQLELSNAREGFINPDVPDNYSNTALDISYLIAWAKQNKLIGDAGASLLGINYLAEPSLKFIRDNPEKLDSLILLSPKFPETERLKNLGASELTSYSKITIPTLMMTNELDDEDEKILKDIIDVIPNASVFNSRGAPLSALNIAKTMARQSEFILKGR